MHGQRGSDRAAATNHEHRDLPFLLAGSCGGHFATGRFVDYQANGAAGHPHNDLLVSLANAHGHCRHHLWRSRALHGPPARPDRIEKTNLSNKDGRPVRPSDAIDAGRLRSHGKLSLTPPAPPEMPTDASPLAPQAATTAQELHKQAGLWLAISLISSVVCASLCLGVGGAVFCHLSMQAAGQGLIDDAEDKLKWGKILTLVGSIIGILSTTVSLILRG